MNHKQINDLQDRDPFMGHYISDKRGTWYELKEDYIYSIDFLGDKSPTFPKGQRIQFKYMTLGGWLFNLNPPVEPFGVEVLFGRSRLLKLKVKEITIKSDKMRVICDSPHISDRDCEYKAGDDCTLKGECNWKKTIPQNSDTKRST